MAEEDNKVPIKVSAPVTEQPVSQFDASEVITMHSPGQTIHPTTNQEEAVPLPPPPAPPAEDNSGQHEQAQVENSPVVQSEATEIASSDQSPPTEPTDQQPPAVAEPQNSHVVSHPHVHKSAGRSVFGALLIIILTLLLLAGLAAGAIFFLKV